MEGLVVKHEDSYSKFPSQVHFFHRHNIMFSIMGTDNIATSLVSIMFLLCFPSKNAKGNKYKIGVTIVIHNTVSH